MLILSIAGTVVSFLILGLANSLWMLFVSRILDGFLGGNISLAQAYITDVTDKENRARGLGIIGASFGLGFIFGPALGGALSAGENYGRPALAAAILSAFNLLGVLLWLLLIVLAPIALAGGTLNIAINSALTKSVYPESAVKVKSTFRVEKEP